MNKILKEKLVEINKIGKDVPKISNENEIDKSMISPRSKIGRPSIKMLLKEKVKQFRIEDMNL